MDDGINDVLIESVKACGGSKVVGVALWPAMGLEAAQRRLLACLNADRAEKLGPDEVVHIARLARQRGKHMLLEWLCAELGYQPPVPAAPADQRDELQRQFLAAAADLSKLAARIAAL